MTWAGTNLRMYIRLPCLLASINYDLSLNEVETILQDQERYLHDLERKLRLKQSAALRLRGRQQLEQRLRCQCA